MVFAYRLEYSLDLKVARIFNAYGPGMSATDGRVISAFIAQALSGKDVEIFGDGTVIRSFQFVDDCIQGLQSLMENGWRGGPINLGCEVETSISDLAQLIVKKVASSTGHPCVGIRYGDATPDDPFRRRPDCSLAKSVLCWSAKVDLVDGVDQTIAWHLRRPRRTA